MMKKILIVIDDWLEANGLRHFVNENNLKWLLILFTGGAALAIGWSLTRVAIVVFIAYYVLNPLSARRLSQLIIILVLAMAGLLLVGNEYRAANIALGVYLLFGLLLVRLLWDEWRSKPNV